MQHKYVCQNKDNSELDSGIESNDLDDSSTPGDLSLSQVRKLLRTTLQIFYVRDKCSNFRSARFMDLKTNRRVKVLGRAGSMFTKVKSCGDVIKVVL